jgi:hypothetical protein
MAYWWAAGTPRGGASWRRLLLVAEEKAVRRDLLRLGRPQYDAVRLEPRNVEPR